MTKKLIFLLNPLTPALGNIVPLGTMAWKNGKFSNRKMDFQKRVDYDT